MPADDAHDPWQSLADSLGATPARDTPPPASPAAGRPQQPSRKPRSASRPKPAAAAGGSWDDLASELGVTGGESQPQAPPRPAPRPPRVTDDREPRGERQRELPSAHDDSGERRFDEGPPPRGDGVAAERGDRRRGEDGPRDGDDDGDRRGGRRRRRGRRGGRGRGRGDADRPAPVDGARGRDRGPDRPRVDGERGSDDRDLDAACFREETFRSGRDEGREFAEPEADAEGDGREPGADPVDRRGDAVDDEGQPRRRRRRGRRGGRGRGRGDAGNEQPARTQPRDASAAEDDEDPVPTAYGMRAPARTGDSRDDAQRPAAGRDGDDAADGRGRRRRRRGGEGRSRAAAGGESDRGRRRGRDQRKGSRESRSATLSRGRRDDFAPVAGRHDEDDEGLEFLGVEEAGQDTPRRRAPEDDEILAESGLSSVLDVPSWVEAIGIVIAGNLDARTKGRGADRSR